jgi:hypothetical protein
VKDPYEQVPAEIVGAEPEVAVGAQGRAEIVKHYGFALDAAGFPELLIELVPGDVLEDSRTQRKDDHEDDEHAPDNCELVLPETRPEDLARRSRYNCDAFRSFSADP